VIHAGVHSNVRVIIASDDARPIRRRIGLIILKRTPARGIIAAGDRRRARSAADPLGLNTRNSRRSGHACEREINHAAVTDMYKLIV